ncbi:hypothetical protein FIBSPDRAFT_287147 [Athelia psychrophila]|uniref:Uncharacterized protein n=1 Tax=Athelia psychrophila TaxID=1759441 RepID=A0A167XPM5_9AGAM|nr:hypothetical protein FIBSPDRAFT_287147 [Fibularhizoctonia sp. CBS 109695]
MTSVMLMSIFHCHMQLLVLDTCATWTSSALRTARACSLPTWLGIFRSSLKCIPNKHIFQGSAPLNSDSDAYMIEERFWAKPITRLQRSRFLSPFPPCHRYGPIYNADQWRPLAAETKPFPIPMEEPWNRSGLHVSGEELRHILAVLRMGLAASST